MEKYSNVNYDYPSCGGVEVKKGRKYWSVTVLSNYAGNLTDQVFRRPVADKETAKDIAREYTEYMSNNCPDGYGFERVKKGDSVQ